MEKKSFSVCRIKAPCKINLHLQIGGKREDGFHDILGLFAPLDLSDSLRFELTEGEGQTTLYTDWECPGEEIPIESNLVLKAISLFRERTGFKPALRVDLKKRIPLGAGLGGGSSDAASTLLALNLLAGARFLPQSTGACMLPLEELKKMAAFVGSDVPFFLSGGAAIVSGRGELVKPVKLPPGLWVVLVKPKFSSDTSFAYRLLERLRINGDNDKTPECVSEDTLISALDGKIEKWPFFNDFLHIFLSQDAGENGETVTNADVYRSILKALSDSGASFTGLSGSGSCCFGVFCSKETAERTAEEISDYNYFVRLTFFIAHSVIPVLK